MEGRDDGDELTAMLIAGIQANRHFIMLLATCLIDLGALSPEVMQDELLALAAKADAGLLPDIDAPIQVAIAAQVRAIAHRFEAQT